MNVILAPTPGKGFGHQFWAAMVGLDAAASFYNATGTEGRVLLDAGFCSGLRGSTVSSPRSTILILLMVGML